MRFRPAILAVLAISLMGLASYEEARAYSTPQSVAEAAKRLKKPLLMMQTADALGMWRGVGAREHLDQVVRAEYIANGAIYAPSASGPWTKTDVKTMTFAVDYRLLASRVETVTVAGASEARTFKVVRGNLAWDETTLGAGAKPTSEPAEDRLNWIRILPHSFMRAVVTARPQDVQIAKEGGKSVIYVATPLGRGKATIGAGYFPERIELPVEVAGLGKTTLVGVYSGYKDWDGYEVFFPSRINLTLAGKPLADLTVTNHMVGPYLVWPIPQNIGQQANK